MRIKDLPKELQDLAFLRFSEQRGFADNSYLLCVAFDWSKTPEGGFFWSAVEKGFFDTAFNSLLKEKKQKEDSIVNAVIEKFKKRSEIGIKKYGTTLDRDDLSFDQWIEHAIEEAMDLTLYLQKIKEELKNKTL